MAENLACLLKDMAPVSDADAEEFARSFLPDYHGPCVRIVINSSDREYTVSKTLLCKESAYFAAMFESGFSEGETQSAILEAVDGVVSVQSFEGLLQWLYLGRVTFDSLNPEDRVSAIIEFTRLADMCSITGMESQMAQNLKDIFVANPPPDFLIALNTCVNTNTRDITSQHIASAANLPAEHPVRCMLATASVEGFLRNENYKFAEETQNYPTFGADLLREVRVVLRGLKIAHHHVTVEDPISGRDIFINNVINECGFC
ncbi:hypothetical protein N7471_010768 [Penicillium samsonianum]|uniref:uncharacterized protein n=1 Tax=Penicillium samsonianum TaxID=1882272 RepID=UPI00254726D0|nr:uncharacterized protein N7471_010768 [Penicillium samsonianum]KAJ6126275.1 hypothetical protein N7471_010768 [Penicillium samsonianum]